VQKQGRTSFLKKRSKKLFTFLSAPLAKMRLKRQKFFGSFFQKRTSFLPV
jgi:hypothetical protein